MVHLERIKELYEKKNVTMKQAAIELGMTIPISGSIKKDIDE